MTTSRTDTHAPSAFDPAEYAEVGYIDNHPEEGGCWIDSDAHKLSEYDGNYVNRGRCDHCGAGPLRYAVVFRHDPTQRLVFVGERCASKLALGSRSEYERKQLLAQAIRERQRAEWTAQAPVNAEIAAFLRAVSTTDYITFSDDSDDATITGRPFREAFPAVSGGTTAFLSSLDSKLHRYGNLSDKQVAAVAKIKARNDEWLAQRAAKTAAMEDVAPLIEGKRSIEGEIVSTKIVSNDYGSTLKMLVKLDDGTKVFGSVPVSIEELTYSSIAADGMTVIDGLDLVGQRVAFNATVERSRDDQHFGFFKRPTKARVL